MYSPVYLQYSNISVYQYLGKILLEVGGKLEVKLNLADAGAGNVIIVYLCNWRAICNLCYSSPLWPAEIICNGIELQEIAVIFGEINKFKTSK